MDVGGEEMASGPLRVDTGGGREATGGQEDHCSLGSDREKWRRRPRRRKTELSETTTRSHKGESLGEVLEDESETTENPSVLLRRADESS